MAQEFELSDYATIKELQGPETNSGDSEHSGTTPTVCAGTTPTERRLLRIGILTLGVLCIIQATLNVSLRLAFYSKEDTDQCPFNSSLIEDLCHIDQSQQKSTQLCTCHTNLLRRLLREYLALQNNTREDDHIQESGSGSLEDFLFERD